MRHFLPFLFLLPLSAFAQVDQPCTPQLVISYDAAGNRIQRREICDPAGNPGTYRSSAAEPIRSGCFGKLYDGGGGWCGEA